MSNGYCEEQGYPKDEELPFDLEVAWTSDVVDRKGLRRDTWYFVGYQFLAIGILYAMPESTTGWTDEQKSNYNTSIWWDNVTHPSWDSDDHFINYVVHPYWGAAYYVRARERGYDRWGGFWYSVLLSSAFELGAEALFEEPSIQDLVVTPIAGSLVGQYFMGVRDNIRVNSTARGYRTRKEKWVMVLTDPLGALNSQVDKWVGYEASLQIYPYFHVEQRAGRSPANPIDWDSDRVVGLNFRLVW